jgi:mannose/cellobiose epimerase-like protein (N-acyl-D-glucosamine 2-epimerase family)
MWVGDFLDRVMGLWREHADTPNGLFNPYLDRQWRHHVDGPRTLVSQCRLIYTFARAFERSGEQEYADLVQRGIDALMRYFRDADDQGFVWACEGDGSVQDDTYDAYGHALSSWRWRRRHPCSRRSGTVVWRYRRGNSCNGTFVTSTAG